MQIQVLPLWGQWPRLSTNLKLPSRFEFFLRLHPSFLCTIAKRGFRISSEIANGAFAPSADGMIPIS